MAVVGEEDDLGPVCQLGKNFEPGGRAAVVEVDEQIVDDQRQRLEAFELLLDCGQAECEIQLVASTFAHFVDGDLGTIRTPAEQDYVAAVIKAGCESGVALAGEPGEEVAGASKQRPVALLAELLNLQAKDGDREFQACVLLGLFAYCRLGGLSGDC